MQKKTVPRCKIRPAGTTSKNSGAEARSTCFSLLVHNLSGSGLGFRGLGFRGLGFRGLGFRV